MKINLNPFDTGNPMTLRDAAIIAAIAAGVIWILEFFANAQWAIIMADPAEWCFLAIKDYIVRWAGVFISETGLHEVVKHAK